MDKLIMVINDGSCKAVKLANGKLETTKISELPKDLTATLNKYMVSDELDFDLRDPELDRSNLEQSEESLEDKRMKMVDDALSAIEPLAAKTGSLTVLSSNRYIGKLRKKAESFQATVDVIEFVPSGANKGEEESSIVARVSRSSDR